jgi:hypothetical protein
MKDQLMMAIYLMKDQFMVASVPDEGSVDDGVCT